MRNKPNHPDGALAECAALQHGIVTHSQLQALGLSRYAIARRVRSGRLHRVHRSVYAVGHADLSFHRRWMSAVRACGDGAVLSHASAAALWELIKPIDGPIDVSIPSGSPRRHDGIRVHRRASLAQPDEVARRAQPRAHESGGAEEGEGVGRQPPPALTVHDRIPVTAPWLTIDDLRTSKAVSQQLYRHAVRQAELRRFVLSPATPRDGTRSDPERDFLALCREYRAPKPEVNARVGRWTVDFLWPAARLVVEIDTWGTHGGSVAFEDDHERDLGLRRLGYTVHRYTDVQLELERDRIAADLLGALGAK